MSKLVGYLLLLAILYYSSLEWLVTKDWNREDFNYAYFIPAVALYLLWDKRYRLNQIHSNPDWLGLLPMSIGVFLFWLGELSGEFFSIYISLWLLVVGACWLHLGWQKLKIIGFPLLLCLAMFPPPNFIYANLSLKLKLISSRLGVWVLQGLGKTAYREGNIIDMGFTKLQVVDACNGLRYLFPLIVLAILVAYFSRSSWWKKIIVVFSAIPISIFVNGLRIASVGLLYPVFGPQVAEGFFHDFSGWIIFMISLGVLLAELWILNRIFREDSSKLKAERTNQGTEIEKIENGGIKEFEQQKLEIEKIDNPACGRAESSKQLPTAELKAQSVKLKAESQNQKTVEKSGETKAGKLGFFQPQFVVAVVLLSATAVLAQTVNFREEIPIARPFDQFPLHIGEWTGKSQTMEQKFIDELDLSDYIIVNYRNGSGPIVNFYTAYYESQRKGESIHSPASCLPGGGWEFHQAGQTEVSLPGRAGQKIPVNRAVMSNLGYKQLSYYWFPTRGRTLTNAYQMKLYNFWDALTRQRTDGALVRLITPIRNNETIEDADARLQAFTKELVPVLDEFLPQ